MHHKRLVLMAVGVCAIAVALPRVPQNPAYHLMADQRTLAGIPHAFDVLSNLPFILVGALGLAAVIAAPATAIRTEARWPWEVFFVATIATAFGSIYYHLAPTNDRVVWDRLPIAIAFVSLLSAVIAERVDARTGRLLCLPLICAAAGSVVYWYWSELAGHGDLRPYACVQFGSFLVLAAILTLYREPIVETQFLVSGLAAYGLAKLCEMADLQIHATTHVVSGHTLKHLFAVAGVACTVVMLRRRSEEMS